MGGFEPECLAGWSISLSEGRPTKKCQSKLVMYRLAWILLFPGFVTNNFTLSLAITFALPTPLTKCNNLFFCGRRFSLTRRYIFVHVSFCLSILFPVVRVVGSLGRILIYVFVLIHVKIIQYKISLKLANLFSNPKLTL